MHDRFTMSDRHSLSHKARKARTDPTYQLISNHQDSHFSSLVVSRIHVAEIFSRLSHIFSIYPYRKQLYFSKPTATTDFVSLEQFQTFKLLLVLLLFIISSSSSSNRTFMLQCREEIIVCQPGFTWWSTWGEAEMLWVKHRVDVVLFSCHKLQHK